MKGDWIVVLTVTDAESSLEVAEILAPLKGLSNVRVGPINPRPQQPTQAQTTTALGPLATPPDKSAKPSG